MSDTKSSELELIKKKARQNRSAIKDGWNVQFADKFSQLSVKDIKSQPQKVGLLYDDLMTAPECTWDPKCPEKPDRLRMIQKRCDAYGLFERCEMLKTRMATEDEVLLKHSEEYLCKVKSTADLTEEQLRDLSSTYDCIYFHKETYQAAMMAVGCSIEAVNHVVSHKVRSAMALVRPPGHHAMKEEACGFCIFNNAAIAAEHALETLGLSRILIVDWDVHHGQGTQYMFCDDPRVLYFSIHNYQDGQAFDDFEEAKFWPNLRESDYDYVGEGTGKGFNINVPLSEFEHSDSDYMAFFRQILMPIATEFTPELVIVSGGFDAAVGDPEGKNNISPVCYGHLTHMLRTLAGGKLCVLLEGGYCLETTAEAAAVTLTELLGDPCPSLEPLPAVKISTRTTILQLIRVLRPFWKCLSYHSTAEDESKLPEIFQNCDIPTQDKVFSTPENRPDKFPTYDDYLTFPDSMKDKVEEAVKKALNYTRPVKTEHRTCLAYDVAMKRHKPLTNPFHPEQPDRISYIYDKHAEYGLLDRCKQVESRRATDDEIAYVHSREYINTVRGYRSRDDDDLMQAECGYDSIYLSQDVYDCACLATGSTLHVVDEVLTGKCLNGVCIVRPPGHHAEPQIHRGFCFFNTVAIAARYAQKKYNLKRVLILDWDVHHGNGTQHAFEKDPSVLVINLHRHDKGHFYPVGPEGSFRSVGCGEGRGFNVNVSWAKRDVGDAEYVAAFQQIVMPIAYEFAPELVLVSAGYDAAKGDPLGGCRVTPLGYAQMTHMLSSLAGGKVILALEGGYNLEAISEAMCMCTSVLLGDQCAPLPRDQTLPTDTAIGTIRRVLNVHQEFWNCLKYRVFMPARRDTKRWLARMRGEQPIDISNTSTPSPISEDDSLVAEMQSLKVEGGDQDVKAVNLFAGEKMSEAGEASACSAGESMGACGGGDPTTIADLLDGVITLSGSDELYAVQPLSWCPHLESVQPLPSVGLDTLQACSQCGHEGENWVCLVCYQVNCSRYVNEHCLIHGVIEEHRIVLSYADLSVWCYACENYVHNEVILPAKRAAHRHKFNSDMPGS